MSDQAQAKLAQLLKKVLEERGTPMRRDSLKVLADNDYDRFAAWVAAGFTESQALYLTVYKP